MKSFFFIFLILFPFVSNSAFGQTCVQCNGNTTLGNDYSSALGKDNTSTGSASFTAGKSNTADTTYTVAIGSYISATGIHSMGLGHYLSASGEKSIVIGTGASSFMKLCNTTTKSLMIGFGSTKPTLFMAHHHQPRKQGKSGLGM